MRGHRPGDDPGMAILTPDQYRLEGSSCLHARDACISERLEGICRLCASGCVGPVGDPPDAAPGLSGWIQDGCFWVEKQSRHQCTHAHIRVAGASRNGPGRVENIAFVRNCAHPGVAGVGSANCSHQYEIQVVRSR